MRTLGKAFAIVTLLAAPVVFGGCRALGGFLGGTSPSAGPATPPVPSEQPSTPQVGQQPAATPAAPTPQATPAQQPAVTQEQAQDVVRAWFEALAAGDYQRAEGLTTGNAQRQTRQMVDTLQREAGQRGVQVQLAIQRLDLGPAAQPPNGHAVHADFDINVNAIVGPMAVPARQLQGSANFVVEPTADGPKISDIRDVSGLPSG